LVDADSHGGRRGGGHPAASGALFAYAWGGFVLTWLKYRMDPVSYAGNVVFALGAFALVTAAWRCAGTAGSRAAELAAG
jgi:hypothetical protein